MDSVLILLLAVVIVGAGLLGLVFIGKPRAKRLDMERYRAKWLEIDRMLGSAHGNQLAVIHADRLVDEAMRERGLRGKNMGERLKGNPRSFSQINDLWEAHKLRNRIAHESSTVVDTRAARRALDGFKIALRDLGALL